MEQEEYQKIYKHLNGLFYCILKKENVYLAYKDNISSTYHRYIMSPKDNKNIYNRINKHTLWTSTKEGYDFWERIQFVFLLESLKKNLIIPEDLIEFIDEYDGISCCLNSLRPYYKTEKINDLIEKLKKIYFETS